MLGASLLLIDAYPSVKQEQHHFLSKLFSGALKTADNLNLTPLKSKFSYELNKLTLSSLNSNSDQKSQKISWSAVSDSVVSDRHALV